MFTRPLIGAVEIIDAVEDRDTRTGPLLLRRFTGCSINSDAFCRRSILGYTATSTVRVNLTDLTLLTKVIDGATKAGASNINRLTFGLRDEKAARGRALAEAADQAKAGAESLADTLKLKLMRIARVEEVQPVIISPGREIEILPLKDESSSSPSLSPGSIQIRASINFTPVST